MISIPQLEELRRISARLGISMAEIIRDALKQYLKEKK